MILIPKEEAQKKKPLRRGASAAFRSPDAQVRQAFGRYFAVMVEEAPVAPDAASVEPTGALKPQFQITSPFALVRGSRIRVLPLILAFAWVPP